MADRKALASLVFALLTGGALSLVACSSDDGQPGGGGGGGGSSGGTASVAEAGGGTKKNAEACGDGAECESGVCFIGGNQSFCSVACTAGDAVTKCVAPFSGSCNNRGFCKRD